MKRIIAALALFSLTASAWAAPQAVVDAVQAPAWRDRDGRAEPLAPGMELQSRDRVRTGEGARVYLKLVDGSTVKLGENGALLAERLGPSEKRFFSAALDVAQGAFRYTTGKLRKLSQRDVTIRLATVTAGIRGTDIWGKTEPERDFVCLLEGRITVSHKDGDSREMSEPLTFYVAPRNQPPKGIEKADPETVKKWAAETEIQAGAGVLRRGGKWKLLLASTDSQEAALEVYDRVAVAGYAASIRPRIVGESIRYEILLRNLPGKTEAKALAARLKAQLGLEARPTL
ncbi:MAG: FecR domain-containing protein [Rhodocyclaceae bacterium]|nr:FecR domain-containing protein [Rhodocyclaceae bacterium]